MENFRRDKRVILAAALLALVSLVALGSSLKDVTFQPARQLSHSDSETIRVSVDEVVSRIVEVPVWKQVVCWILLFFFILLISALLSPEMRKRLLLGFLRFTLFVVLFLYIMKKNPGIFQGLLALASLGSGPANPALLKDIPPPIFEPPHVSAWFSFLVAFGMILLAALTVWRINRWWIRRNEFLNRRRPLEELAEIARSSLQELSLGTIPSHEVIIQCYMRLNQAVDAQRGIQRDFAMTPSEFSERLKKAGLPRRPVDRLTHLFESVRYGTRICQRPDVDEAVSCLTSILKYCGEVP
jgi:Domain of unknown function (DUF4129)